MHWNSLFTATTAPINYPIIGRGDRGYINNNNNVTGKKDCHHWRNLQTSQGFKSLHKGGAQFVFADGSVQFLFASIDYLVYNRLGCRRDGDPLGEGF